MGARDPHETQGGQVTAHLFRPLARCQISTPRKWSPRLLEGISELGLCWGPELQHGTFPVCSLVPLMPRQVPASPTRHLRQGSMATPLALKFSSPHCRGHTTWYSREHKHGLTVKTIVIVFMESRKEEKKIHSGTCLHLHKETLDT